MQTRHPNQHLVDLLCKGNFEEFNKQRPAGTLDLTDDTLEWEEMPDVFRNVDFRAVIINNCDGWENATFTNCNFQDADLKGCHLGFATFTDCDLSNADFDKVVIGDLDISVAAFASAKNIAKCWGNPALVAAALAFQNQELLLVQLDAMWETMVDARPIPAQRVWNALRRYRE